MFNFDRVDWSSLRDVLDKCDPPPSDDWDDQHRLGAMERSFFLRLLLYSYHIKHSNSATVLHGSTVKSNVFFRKKTCVVKRQKARRVQNFVKSYTIFDVERNPC